MYNNIKIMLYYRLLGKYREIDVIDETQDLITFNYSLGYVSYVTALEKSELIRKEDLPSNAEIIKYRDTQTLQIRCAVMAQRRKEQKRRIAQKGLFKPEIVAELCNLCKN